MPTDTDTDPASWHRHFAAQANNRAWDLAESRTDARRDAEMLAAAHAAAWHWDAVGTELHRMRALMLLALVNALAGHGHTAWQQAETVRTFFLCQSETPDWETAFVHAVHSLAAALGRLTPPPPPPLLLLLLPPATTGSSISVSSCGASAAAGISSTT